jgi:hypothetical protein
VLGLGLAGEDADEAEHVLELEGLAAGGLPTGQGRAAAAPPAASPAGGRSKLCCQCNKTVYEMERLLALKKLWHKSCFCCHSCKRVLRGGEWSDNGGNPWCPTCYRREFKVMSVLDEPAGGGKNGGKPPAAAGEIARATLTKTQLRMKVGGTAAAVFYHDPV